MATTTYSTMIPTPQPKKPGPPVPPRPQQSSLLKTQQRDASSSYLSSPTSPSPASAAFTTNAGKVGSEQSPSQLILKKSISANASNKTNIASSTTSVTSSGGRTVIYKSPSLNLQKRQEEREKRNEASTQTATTAITRTTSAAAATSAAKVKLTNGTQAPKPPLKLRKAPDVPTNKPRITSTTPTTLQADAKDNEIKASNDDNSNGNSNNNNNNIVIVQSPQSVVTLNRHHSMGSSTTQNKPSALSKDTRLSLGKVDFERVGKIQVQQLQPTSQPLPKPRKIVKVPVATLDVEDTTSSSTTSSSSGTLHVNLFKRSKTSIENFTSRSNITTVNTSGTGSYLSGKTVEIKNNLKNAAERLFSEIMVNQQKQNAIEANMMATNTIITKHERAIQRQGEAINKNHPNTVTVVTTPKDYNLNNDNNNCTRINITTNNGNNSAGNTRQVVSAFNSPEKKSAAFHEMLISELAAMRTRSCSMENLQTKSQSPPPPRMPKESNHGQHFQNYKQFKTLENQLKSANSNSNSSSNNKQQHLPPPTVQRHHHSTTDDDIDADNVEDADGDGDVEEDLKKSLKVITAQNTPRKRTPSGCSSDSSPYGTERSARIRTSDWIEVGDNGKQVTLTSCHISLEDSGLEDEERMDEMSSSGVGDSWDSVKEAEQHQQKQQIQQQLQQQQQQQQLQQQQQTKRSRNVKRIMSNNDLPPLPKSLSGINKMLASDSGLVSDVDADTTTANKNFKNCNENQKENNNNNNNLNINKNKNNNHNNHNNNNHAHKDASDNVNNASATMSAISSTMTTTTATTTVSSATATTIPLKEINGNETISEIPPAIPGSKLDTQIATLRKEMFGLRQLDLSLLSQLWALNDSIQEFRTMIQEHDQDDDETYSTHSHSPSPYDSVSSDNEDEILALKHKKSMELQNGNVITTQPKLTTTNTITTNTTTTSLTSSSSTSLTTAALTMNEQKSQMLKPPLPKPLDVKPVPRMRSAPPPPPTHRKSQMAPPRPT